MTGSLRTAIAARSGYLLIQGGSSLLVFALLARALPAAELDVAATALAVFVTAQALCDLGLSQVATAEIPRHDGDPARAATVTAAVARLALRTAVVTALVTGLAALAVPAGAAAAVLIAAPAAAMAVLVTAAESMARAHGDVVTPLRLALASRGTFFLTTPLVLATDDARIAMALFSGALVLGSLPAARRVLRDANPARGGQLRLVAGAALAIGAAGALVALGTRGNVVVLAHLARDGEVGAFEGAWRVYQLLLYGAGAVATASTPFAARALAGGGRRALARATGPGLLALAGAGAAGGLVLYLAAGPVVRAFFGGGDEAAEGAVRGLALALPASFVLYYLQTAVALPLLRLRGILAAASALCVTTVALTAALAGDRGAEGAATAVLAGQLAGLVVLACDVALAARRSGAAAGEHGAEGGGEDPQV